MAGNGTTRFPRWAPFPSETVARATVRAIRLGRHEIIPNFAAWCLSIVNRLCPRLIDEATNIYG